MPITAVLAAPTILAHYAGTSDTRDSTLVKSVGVLETRRTSHGGDITQHAVTGVRHSRTITDQRITGLERLSRRK